jgi:hypothetical protein
MLRRRLLCDLYLVLFNGFQKKTGYTLSIAYWPVGYCLMAQVNHILTDGSTKRCKIKMKNNILRKKHKGAENTAYKGFAGRIDLIFI